MTKVMLDPGHGGNDPGALGNNGLHEADVNLSVAKLVTGILAPVADVQMTRYTDTALGAIESIDLTARANAANTWSADVFVSIHCNSSMHVSAAGTETFYYLGSIKGTMLSKAIHTKLIAATALPDRGIKAGNFAVLRQTNMPACLVEIAFISNPAEEALLMLSTFQALVAGAIAAGIADYLGLKLPAQSAGPAASAWAKNSWAKAVAAGVFDGSNPQGQLTREQAAVVLDRLGMLK